MKTIVDNVLPYAVAIAGMPQYYVAVADVQRRYSWENKYAKKQGKSKNKTKREAMPRKNEEKNAGCIYVVTKRIGRGGNDKMEYPNIVRERHGSSVCTKCGQTTWGVECGRKITKTNTRRTVEK